MSHTENISKFEQFIKMICEAFEFEILNESCEFSDVVNGAWYEKYIVTAVGKGTCKIPRSSVQVGFECYWLSRCSQGMDGVSSLSDIFIACRSHLQRR